MTEEHIVSFDFDVVKEEFGCRNNFINCINGCMEREDGLAGTQFLRRFLANCSKRSKLAASSAPGLESRVRCAQEIRYPEYNWISLKGFCCISSKTTNIKHIFRQA